MSGPQRKTSITSPGSTLGPLPTFLVIAAPKSGTTALAAYLAEHPDVYVAPEKEVHYFDQNFGRGVDWYRSRFAGARGERAIGEASPTYMYDRTPVERMAALVPHARLIAVLRNPVDRAYSHYWWERSLTETRPFGEAVRTEMRDGSGGRRDRYLYGGRYLDKLELVTEYFPRDNLSVVLMEELLHEPERTFSAVCRFLDVDDSVKPPSIGKEVNPAYRLRSPALRRFMFRFHLARRLPQGWGTAIDRWNRKPFRYPPMEPALRADLLRWFADDNAALARWLGRDLQIWNA